ncbi:MAG: zinc ABC transporter substrate-binding protein [Hyphomicrobiaceae bacterium]
MEQSRLKRLGGFLALAWAAGHVFAAPAVAADEPDVVVTIKPIHALVSEVMEGVGKPVLIVQGSASPHTFTLKPSSASAISKAQVFVRVSEHLEPFTRKLVEGLPDSVTLLTLADQSLGVKLLDMRQTGTFEPHHHDHEGEHEGKEPEQGEEGDDDHDHEAGEVKDPHIWLDPDNAKSIVTAVARVLSEKWPEYKDKFQTNAEKTRARIDALDADIANQLKSVQSKPFVVFHDAYQYFDSHFGLSAVGSITVSPDQQPSAKRLTEVRAKIRELKAGCVFAEPTFQPKLLATVTEDTGARIGELDPVGQTLEPGPQLYDQLLQELAHNLVACLNAPAAR